MIEDPVDNGFSGRSPSFWTAGRWFVVLIILLFASVGGYLYTHADNARTGYQLTQFSSSNIDQLNRILYNASIPVIPARQIKDTAHIVAAGDSTISDSARQAYERVQQTPLTMQVCDDTCRINKALLYVRTEFDSKLQKDQEDIIKAYITTFSAQEVGSYLAQLKLKVTSYFWLSGPFMYLEMIFWVIFGVICSNLFMLGNLGRTRGFAAFDPREVPYQVAKFFYAPFCTIMLILLYNYVKQNDVIEVHATEGMIVFSFIAGLFSGRMMSFLERFKDALLPETVRTSTVTETRKAERPMATAVESVAVHPKPERQRPVEKIQQEEHTTMINDLYKEPEATIAATPEPGVEDELNRLSSSLAFTADAYTEPEPDIIEEPAAEEPGVIAQVVVMLNLDISGLYEEEKNEIINIGFVNAVVTMHNVNGKDTVTARKSDDKYTASFVAANVKPGIYIVRCTLTQKLSDDYTINLFGEKTAYVTNENKMLELFIKKYEAID
jgi:hypothetical protein